MVDFFVSINSTAIKWKQKDRKSKQSNKTAVLNKYIPDEIIELSERLRWVDYLGPVYLG